LEKGLRQPCKEEIAASHTFADAVAGGGGQFVVIDTAPTGHMLLLLDAAEPHHTVFEEDAAYRDTGVVEPGSGKLAG